MTVTGTPGCKGVYTGKARVVLSLNEADTIQKVSFACNAANQLQFVAVCWQFVVVILLIFHNLM